MLLVIVASLVLRAIWANNVSPAEVDALYDLYVATNGEYWEWQNVTYSGEIWNFAEPDPNPCDPVWQGITCTCDDYSCTITELLLENYGLNGTLPEALGNLTNIMLLSLAINDLYGTLPSSMNQLARLYFLDMSENGHLAGPLLNLESTTSLEFFYMSYNRFSGPIPAGLFEHSSLRFVELANNRLSGTLPSMSSLEAVVFFDLSVNEFSGSLPSSVGNMTEMVAFFLNDNSLNGTIPTEVCKLNKLETMYFIDNYISGSIPDCIGEMSSLVLLSFNANKLNGTIPASIVLLNKTLTELTFSFNGLTGSLPSNLFNASGSVLDTVYFSHNSLTGPLPDFVLPSLLNIDLSYNYVSGTIANTIMNSSDLIYMDISYNELEGTIPAEINHIPYLFQLVVGHNKITGLLPDSVAGHERMAQYMLDFNLFTGTIPSSLCYNEPIYIDLESNLLTGTIPDCSVFESYVGGNLVYFSMSENILSGSIPSYVVNEWNVFTISLNNNGLTGTLPYFNSTKALQYLYVQSNHLNGPIQLSPEYQMLNYVDLSNNQLTGPIPKNFFNSEMELRSFAATSNCITGSIPEELCSVNNLTFVDLDGLSTAKECRSPIFPGIPSLTSFVLPNQIQGGIPECLFGMPFLQTLHISGNSIDWSFPTSGLILSESLSELSLSHNKLTGPVPDVIQERQWSTLDLSFNRLGGTLDQFVEQVGENTSLVLQVNRLSGTVPSSLLYLHDINILTGNLFSCDLQRNGLPSHDQAYDTYQCGSNSFNQASIGWVVCVALSVLVLGLSMSHWTLLNEWFSNVKSTFHRYLAQFTEIQNELTIFKNNMDYLRRAVVLFTACILVIFLPVYTALTHYFQTAQYQYAWTVSAAFLSGVSPAITLLVFYSLLIVLLFCIWFCRTRQSSISLEDLQRTVLHKEAEKKKTSWGYQVILVGVVGINCVVMVLVNAGYVIIVLNDSSQAIFLAQVAIALFKLLWNDFAARGMIALAKQVYGRIFRKVGPIEDNYHFSVDMPYLTFIVLFNSIIAPCLATAAVDSNCFYNIIVAPSAVSLQFPYFNVVGTCNFIIAEYTGMVVCGSFAEETFVEVTYDPPFIYSYQCSSSILTNYAAVYVLMFLIVAFFKPLALLFLHRIYSRQPVGSYLYQCIDFIMYELLKPANVKDLQKHSSEEETTESSRKVLFFQDRFVLRMVGKIAVLITFGVIFPPLAVVVCTAFISEIYVNYVLIGRFLAEVEDEKIRSQFRDVLKKDCAGCMRLLLNPLVTLVVPFAALFYGFFVFDTYGDKTGFAEAIWAPIFLAMVPVVLWIGFTAFKAMRNKHASRDDVRSSEMVIINALQNT